MNQILLSIIIPVYNLENYINKCLLSIYSAEVDSNLFEVIIVDDGSSDNTKKICEKFAKSHKNIKIISQENSGVSVARNNGIKAAKGIYVLFLDADDELKDKALQDVCIYLQKKEPMDMLVTRQIRRKGVLEWMTDEPSLEEHRRYDGKEAYKHHYVRTNAGGGICRTAFLREYNIHFPEGVKNAEDTIFFCHLQVFATSIVYYNLPLYIINEVEGSASHHNDHTKLGKSLLFTVRSMTEIKRSLNVTREQKAIFDYVIYQLLSNTIAEFVSSKQLSYYQFRQNVDVKPILPLDTDFMYQMRRKAQLMNFSLPLFYFLSWMKHAFHND